MINQHILLFILTSLLIFVNSSKISILLREEDKIEANETIAKVVNDTEEGSCNEKLCEEKYGKCIEGTHFCRCNPEYANPNPDVVYNKQNACRYERKKGRLAFILNASMAFGTAYYVLGNYFLFGVQAAIAIIGLFSWLSFCCCKLSGKYESGNDRPYLEFFFCIGSLCNLIFCIWVVIDDVKFLNGSMTDVEKIKLFWGSK